MEKITNLFIKYNITPDFMVQIILMAFFLGLAVVKYLG